MQEMIHRERATEFQKTAFLGRIIGAALNVDSSFLARAEEMLSSTIFQSLYSPSKMRQKIDEALLLAREEKEARLRDARLLQKTASYSDDADEEDEAMFAALMKRRKRHA